MNPLKQPLSYIDQIENLKTKHALIIGDENVAKEILNKVNYYRLSAYGIGLKRPGNSELYRQGITLEHIYSLYCFDSKLRNVLIPIIEHLEIELRTKISYHLAMSYGAEGYRNANNFLPSVDRQSNSIHANTILKFDREIIKQKNLPCVIHHNSKYGGHFPVWAAFELFTFGMLSSLYSVMKPIDKKAITDQYCTDNVHFKSWVLSLVELRNICAHYGRIYNMPLKQTPQLYTEYKQYQSNRLFSVLLVIKRMTESCDAWSKFQKAIEALMNEHSEVQLPFIGFPIEWEQVLLC